MIKPWKDRAFTQIRGDTIRTRKFYIAGTMPAEQDLS